MEEVLGSIPRRDHHSLFGELAQLAARFFSIEEVASSILALSIYFPENMGFLFKYMKCRFKLAMHTSSSDVGQGTAVVITRDSNTIFVGGPLDNLIGAVWVFVR